MKISKIVRSALFTLLAVAMVFGCFGCSQKEENTGDLPENYEPEVSGKLHVTCQANVYPNESSQSGVKNWISYFRSKYPNCSVEVDFNSTGYAAQIASKSIGDVFWLDDGSVYEYAITEDALMPLDSYIEVYGIDMENLYAGITELGVVNGKTYMAAMTCGQQSFVYNVGAMREAGLLGEDETISNSWTWEDFKTYAEALTLTNEDGTYSQVAMTMPVYWGPYFHPFLVGFGGSWYDLVNKKITLYSDDLVVKGVGELMSALEKGWILPSGTSMGSVWSAKFSNISTSTDCVFQNLTALTVLSSTGKSLDNLGIEWDVATFPLFEYAASPCGTLGFGVFSYSSNPDAAAALVLSLYTEDGQYAIHSQTGGDVPIVKSLGSQDFWHLSTEGWEDKNYDAFVANYEKYIPGHIKGRVPTEISTIIEDGWVELLNTWYASGASWQDKLASIEEKCNQIWSTLS